MNPYYFPQIRIATVEGLPDTASVSWGMDFYGYQGYPSRLELFEQGHSAVVHISDYVYGTLTLTPTITGADASVDPITLEFTEKPKAVWQHGGQTQETAVATLVPENFRRMWMAEGYIEHYFVCFDSRVFVPILRADSVHVGIIYSSSNDTFLEVLCQQYDSIERNGNEIVITNPRGPVFIKSLSPHPCQDGYIDAWLFADNADYLDSLLEHEHIELGVPVLENVWIATISGDYPSCDYTIEWAMQHLPVISGTAFLPRVIEISDRAIVLTTGLSECTPIARPLSPGVVEIEAKLVPRFQDLPEIVLDPIYLTLTLGGCSAPESSS